MRTFTGLIVAMAAIVLAAAPIAAQEGSPEAGSPTAATSLLAGLGYPEIVITTDGTDYTIPMEIAAGRYRLVIENSSADLSADVILAMSPEGMAFDEMVAILEASDAEETIPEELFTFTFAGGAYAFPQSTNDSIVTLGPGEWVVDFNAYSETDEEAEGVRIRKPLTVTGELPELTDPPADVVANAMELQFDIPETLPAGPQIWQFANTGEFLHHIVIEQYPEPVTPEQVQATLNMFFGIPATPAASPVPVMDEEGLTFVDQGQILSPGQANWYEYDLAPGTYIAFCFISGPGDVPPHALEGMFRIFTVE